MRKGEIWWAALPEPSGSGPGFRRPVVIVSSNSFNDSRISTLIVAAITTNLRLADAPGNVQVSGSGSGLTKPSVINVSQIMTIDKTFLSERTGRLTARQMVNVENGLRLVLAI